mgnify:CR=1 FL=1
MREKTVAIIGQGYVGLPLAMAAVDAGWSVIGIEKSVSRVDQLNSGSSPVEDISDIRLAKALSEKKYVASNNPSDVSTASVITICVPTPLNAQREPDLGLLESATRDVAPFLAQGSLLVSESTSYPGTLREVIIPIVESLKPKESVDVYFASAPERVDPGNKAWNQKNTPRLVGAINEESKIRNGVYQSDKISENPGIKKDSKKLQYRVYFILLINTI